MATLAFALPLTPGKTEAWLRWGDELLGERRAEYEASRRRLGVTVERCFLQHTPQGDLNVVVLEAEDLAVAFHRVATSQEPFDVWFSEKAKEYFSGLDLGQPLPGPLAELVFDGGAR